MTDGTAVGFGERLRTLRLKASMSQWELAQVAGIHPATISRLEHGHHVAGVETRKRLGRALKTRELAS